MLKHEDELYGYLCSITTIDAHEHFKPEAWHLANTYDFGHLFQYAIYDMVSAGMKYFDPFDTKLSAHDKWRRIDPYWPAVRYGSYARGVRLVIKDLIGEDDLTAGNYRAIGEALNSDNKPGIYSDYFVKRGRIERLISSNGTRATEMYAYTPDDYEIQRLIIGITSPQSKNALEYYELATGMEMRTTGQVEAAIGKFVADCLADKGVVGFKVAAHPMGQYDPKAAQEALTAVAAGQPTDRAQRAALNRFWYDEAFELIRKADYPVAVHCGVWDDFRELDVVNFIDVLKRFPEMQFDLFHMSIPSTREAALVGKSFANAHLNLCWAPIVSQHIVETALQEWLDMVPVSKVSGFGGDASMKRYLLELEGAKVDT